MQWGHRAKALPSLGTGGGHRMFPAKNRSHLQMGKARGTGGKELRQREIIFRNSTEKQKQTQAGSVTPFLLVLFFSRQCRSWLWGGQAPVMWGDITALSSAHGGHCSSWVRASPRLFQPTAPAFGAPKHFPMPGMSYAGGWAELYAHMGGRRKAAEVAGGKRPKRAQVEPLVCLWERRAACQPVLPR